MCVDSNPTLSAILINKNKHLTFCVSPLGCGYLIFLLLGDIFCLLINVPVNT